MAVDVLMRGAPDGRLRFGNAELDVQNLRLAVNGEIRPLEPKSLRLLLFLIENRARVVSKEEIMRAIWPDTSVTDNALTRAVGQIRKALDDDAKQPTYLETVPTVGYRFIAELRASPVESPVEPAPVRRRTPAVAAMVVAGAIVGGWILAHSGIRPISPLRQTKLTYFPGDETDPAFSPDGRSLAFSWNGGAATRDIYVLRMGGHDPVRVTQDMVNDISPAWSPDGTQIAYLRLDALSRASLVVIPARGGAGRSIREVRLIDDFNRAIRPLLTWTPDGKGIVYTTQDDASEHASLYFTDLEGTSRRRLVVSSEASTGAASPSFSSDGKMLAYTEVFGPYQARLFVCPVGAGMSLGTATPVTEPASTLVTSPVWSPDGKRLWFMRDSSIYEWSAGRSPRRIYVGTGFSGITVAWGAGAMTRVVTGDLDSHAELRTIPLGPGGMAAAGNSELFTPFTGQSSPGVSPDGKRFVFHSSRSGNPEIWEVDADGRNARQLTHLGSFTMGFPKWSPDGRRIAFHAWVGSKPQIHTLDVDRVLNGTAQGKLGDGAKQITDAPLGFFSPAWSPDGKYIYANRSTGVQEIFRIASEGGTPEELFEGTSCIVTPGGRAILYSKIGRLGIFSRSLEGDVATNSEQKLVDDYKPPGADLAAFADGLYYIGWNGPAKPRAVRFYNFTQKRSVDVAPLPGRIPDVPGLAITPDRRRLVYSVFIGTGRDLTLIDFQ